MAASAPNHITSSQSTKAQDAADGQLLVQVTAWPEYLRDEASAAAGAQSQTAHEDYEATQQRYQAAVEHAQEAILAGQLTETDYPVSHAREALAQFVTDHPEIMRRNEYGGPAWRLEAITPGQGEQPERLLRNWERDPMAEASDGWLSNIAVSGTNLMRDLEWQPRYCTAERRETPCPSCGQPLRILTGRYGQFYRCPCGATFGYHTRRGRDARAKTRVLGWCGTLLVVRYNINAVPYAGCPTCDPDYRHPTVDDVYHGRDLRRARATR